jgi:ribose transport system permease protein
MLNNLLNFSGVSSYYQWVLQGVIILLAVGLHNQDREA